MYICIYHTAKVIDRWLGEYAWSLVLKLILSTTFQLWNSFRHTHCKGCFFLYQIMILNNSFVLCIQTSSSKNNFDFSVKFNLSSSSTIKIIWIKRSFFTLENYNAYHVRTSNRLILVSNPFLILNMPIKSLLMLPKYMVQC